MSSLAKYDHREVGIFYKIKSVLFIAFVKCKNLELIWLKNFGYVFTNDYVFWQKNIKVKNYVILYANTRKTLLHYGYLS